MQDRVAIAGNIIQLIITLQKKLMRPVSQQAKTDLSPLQLYVLDTLQAERPVTMTLLANEIRMSKQQMTRIVGNLVTQELVRRDNDDLDRRVIRIRLTEKGAALLENIKREVRTVLAAKLASFGEDNIAELDDAATRLARLLKDLP